MSPATLQRILAVPWAALAVVAPLAAALAAICLGRFAARLAFPFASVIFVVVLATLLRVWTLGPVEHDIGGWPAPLGIRLRADGLSAAFMTISAIVASAVVAFSAPMFGPLETRLGFAFWPLLFFMWAGLNAVFVSGDLFNLYVAMELLSLTAVSMVGLEGKPAALAAAMRYLIFALLGSLAYLLGVALLYGAYGLLDMRLLQSAVTPSRVTLAAAGLMTAGLMAKTALFPFHVWLPPAHAGAPAPASAMLSGLVVKASFYMLARIWFEVLPAVITIAAAQLAGALGAIAICFGSLLAFRQERLKLLIAYSTVAQIGYLFLMFPLALGADQRPWAIAAWSGGIFHALAHAPAKAAMFLSAGLMAEAAGDDRLDTLAGAARRLPIAAFAFGLASVSLMGLPASGGFTAKYLLLTSALGSGQWWWAVALIVGGLLAAAYLFRVLGRFLSEPSEPCPGDSPSRGREAVALALAGLSILLGLASLAPFELLQIDRPSSIEPSP